jgi:alkylation response protein AidB-like acyl-CoA dehydrogenase
VAAAVAIETALATAYATEACADCCRSALVMSGAAGLAKAGCLISHALPIFAILNPSEPAEEAIL